MRAALLMLALICALPSGWTAALAHTQGLSELRPVFHHATASGDHATAHAAKSQDSECGVEAESCGHPAKPVHPPLCVACFAIPTEAAGLSVQMPVRSRIAPALQAAMRPASVKPRFPPPKVLSPH